MKTGTLKIEIKGDFRRLRDQLQSTRLALALFDAARPSWVTVAPFGGWHAARFRQLHRRRLAAARRLQRDDPRIDIQVVTMADGVCRVVVRRLGGWSIPPLRALTPPAARYRTLADQRRTLAAASPSGAGAAAGLEQQQPQPLAGTGAGDLLAASARSGESPDPSTNRGDRQ